MDQEVLQELSKMLEAQTAKVALLIENDVTAKINLMFEKLDGIDQKLDQVPTAEELTIANGRIDVLEAIVKKLSREVADLKKAQ